MKRICGSEGHQADRTGVREPTGERNLFRAATERAGASESTITSAGKIGVVTNYDFRLHVLKSSQVGQCVHSVGQASCLSLTKSLFFDITL